MPFADSHFIHKSVCVSYYPVNRAQNMQHLFYYYYYYLIFFFFFGGGGGGGGGMGETRCLLNVNFRLVTHLVTIK